jgi:hypothetical protein
MVMGNVLFTSPLARTTFVEVREIMALHFANPETGAEVHLGRTGSGFYVEARHPDFPLPFRKTYEWHQEDLATRDYELLRAVVGAARGEHEPATAR